MNYISFNGSEFSNVQNKPSSAYQILKEINDNLKKNQLNNISETCQVIFEGYQKKLGCKKYFYAFISLFIETNYSKINQIYRNIIKNNKVYIINEITTSCSVIKNEEIKKLISEWAEKEISEKKLNIKDFNEFINVINDFLNNPPKDELRLPSIKLCSLPDIFNHEPFISRLKTFNCDYNNLHNLPPSFWSLTSLKDLSLTNNNLTSLPPEIGNLKSLVLLNLNKNNLKSLPNEIGNLEHLDTLYLNENNLKSLPLEVGKLESLNVLILNDNKLKALPSEIGKLKSLKILNLCNYSKLELNLPKEIYELSKDCCVTFNLMGNSKKTLENLMSTITDKNYAGPTFFYKQRFDNLLGQMRILNTLRIKKNICNLFIHFKQN